MNKTDKAWIDGFLAGVESANNPPTPEEQWEIAFREKHEEQTDEEFEA